MSNTLSNSSLSNKRNRQRSIEPQVSNYEEFVDALYDDLEFIIGDFNKSKDKYYQGMQVNSKQGENLVNVSICSMLNCRGWKADHDAHINGNADIVVTLPFTDYQWLGEGKINSNQTTYPDAYQGLKQLLYRYSTGIDNQNAGGLILYITKTQKNQLDILSNWKDIVASKSEVQVGDELPYAPALKIESCPKSTFVFYSYHTHSSSGLEYTVRHMIIDFRHQPKDRRKK